MGGYAQIWDGLMGLTLGYGHPLYWEQKNHSKQHQHNCTRNMGWISLELCCHSIILKDGDWLGT